MAAKTLKVGGKTITDGQKHVLLLRHGDTERRVEGKVRAFTHDHSARIADLEAELNALRADTTVHWEISTNDPLYPAVGFLPENVLQDLT